MVIALLSASLSFVVGVLAGAALQRWGDAERATEHHTQTEIEPRSDEEIDEVLARIRQARYLGVVITDWGPMQ